MLTLLTFPGSFGAPSHSPFCVKAMCLLEMSGEDWRPEYLNNPSKMPLRKLPVLKSDDRLIPDSAQIQAFLEDRGADFYPDLNADQKAQAHALMRMNENSFELLLAHDRWLTDACWEVTRDVFFSAIPKLIRKPVTNRIRKTVRDGLMSQGIAKFSENDRLTRARLDLDAIMTQLGTQKFLFGDKPSAADASIAPVLDMLAALPAKTGMQQMVASETRATDYVIRARAAIYPKL